MDDYNVEADGARDLGFTSFLIDRNGSSNDEWAINSLTKMVEFVKGD